MFFSDNVEWHVTITMSHPVSLFNIQGFQNNRFLSEFEWLQPVNFDILFIFNGLVLYYMYQQLSIACYQVSFYANNHFE